MKNLILLIMNEKNSNSCLEAFCDSYPTAFATIEW
ncbi:hypothetical protein BJV40_004840 [Clostridium beijerinckii]|nr:hypothetical protein [Clostridium beijerinckii]